MLLRSEVHRVSLVQIRSQFPPSVFAGMRSVRLQYAGVAVDVEIAVLPEPSCKSGARRWLLCPGCSSRTIVVGFVASDPERYGCRACLKWREQARRPVALMAAPAATVGLPADEAGILHPSPP